MHKLEKAQGRLNGKVALIVGAGDGIGAAAALMFARERARVAVADIDAEQGAAVAAAIAAHGGDAAFFQVDVTSDDNVKAMVSAVIEHFRQLDVLFNCVGGSLPADAIVTEVDLSVWDHTMTLDVRGTILCCRHALPAIIASGGGAVVNMSSGAALRGTGKAHIYTAAKGAIVSLTRVLAGTYAAQNVRINAICAGRINTARIRQSYGIPGQPGQSVDSMNIDELVKTYPYWFGEPEDVASIALFLASDESRLITGVSIPANGGRSEY